MSRPTRYYVFELKKFEDLLIKNRKSFPEKEKDDFIEIRANAEKNDYVVYHPESASANVLRPSSGFLYCVHQTATKLPSGTFDISYDSSRNEVFKLVSDAKESYPYFPYNTNEVINNVEQGKNDIKVHFKTMDKYASAAVAYCFNNFNNVIIHEGNRNFTRFSIPTYPKPASTNEEE